MQKFFGETSCHSPVLAWFCACPYPSLSLRTGQTELSGRKPSLAATLASGQAGGAQPEGLQGPQGLSRVSLG